MTSEFREFARITQARLTLLTYRSVIWRNIAIQAVVLERRREVCPSVLHEKPTSPSSTHQALRGNDGISHAHGELSQTSQNARMSGFVPPPPFFSLSTTPLVHTAKQLKHWIAECLSLCDMTRSHCCLAQTIGKRRGRQISPDFPPACHRHFTNPLPVIFISASEKEKVKSYHTELLCASFIGHSADPFKTGKPDFSDDCEYWPCAPVFIQWPLFSCHGEVYAEIASSTVATYLTYCATSARVYHAPSAGFSSTV